MDSNNRASGSGKEKKTRRRLRLSCVECTKRRQKCDRKYPCSLCVSRGVSHLCRWETVPLARPAPARPPSAPQDSDQTIQELLSRIACLEKSLEIKNNQYDPQQPPRTKIEPASDSALIGSPSGSSTLASTDPNMSPYTSPTTEALPLSPSPDIYIEDEREAHMAPLCHLGPTVYQAISTLARLSLGHHGEYIGRGSLICALHSISTGSTSRFLYAKSTDSTSVYRESTHGLLTNVLIERVEDLIRSIPPVAVTTTLLERFFAEENWRFGIPEEWFRAATAQMWNVLEYPEPHGIQINANWLSLLFAILAFAPKGPSGVENSDHDAEWDRFFTCAMAARRIAEDDYLNKPNLSLMASAADGTVLSCLAIPILCTYLSQRGRLSEAWKLVGIGLRNAEAVGMHRDPEWRQWQVMSKDEMLLRRRAWWGLFVWDKMYSYLLGRPQMISHDAFDVKIPPFRERDGTMNYFNLYQDALVRLSGMVGELAEKFFGVRYPTSPAFFEMDGRLERWEEHLPPEYQQDREATVTSNLDPADLIKINHQRYVLLTWYLIVRIKLHIASMIGFGRLRPPFADMIESRRLCVLLSIRLIGLQCDTHDAARQYKAENGGSEPAFPGSSWYFEGCFSLFEGTIALLTTLTRYPWPEKIVEADGLADRAICVLRQVGRENVGKKGEISRMAVEVLGALHQEHWWRAQISGGAAQSSPNPTAYPTSSLSTALKMPESYGCTSDQWFSTPNFASGLRSPPLPQHSPGVIRRDGVNANGFNSSDVETNDIDIRMLGI